MKPGDVVLGGEPHFSLSTTKTPEVAREKGLDVAAEELEGSHESHVPASMARSLVFFEGKRARGKDARPESR